MMRIILVVAFALFGMIVGNAQTTPKSSPGADWPVQLRIPTVTVEGIVEHLSRTDGKRGGPAITFTVADAGKITRVLLAPPDYAAKIGLALKNGTRVTVVGVKMPRKEPVVVAMEIVVNAKVYTLREPNGSPKWTDVSVLPHVTLTGTINHVVIPQAQPSGRDTSEPRRMMVTFILDSDNGPTTIAVSPQPYLDTIGLKLREGAEVTVTGWQRLTPATSSAGKPTRTADESLIMAQTIAIGKTIHVIRNADGKPAWMTASPAKPRQGNRR